MKYLLAFLAMITLFAAIGSRFTVDGIEGTVYLMGFLALSCIFSTAGAVLEKIERGKNV